MISELLDIINLLSLLILVSVISYLYVEKIKIDTILMY